MGVCSELRGIDVGEQNEVIRAYVSRCEERGFDSVWVNDHFHQIRPQDSGGSLEAWTVLSAISQYTSRVKLGQLVMCVPFRNPALTAKMATTLDVLSHGRVIVGLGAGWYESEFDGYGYPFLPLKDRLVALSEAVVIIRQMLDGDQQEFVGEHYRIDRPESEPSPVQPHVPILLGGRGKTTLRLVAQHGDMANFSGSLEEFAEAQSRLDEYCDEYGRDPATIERSWMTIGVLVRKTQREVDDVIEEWRANDDVRLIRLQNRSCIVGTPNQVIEVLQGYVDLGCEHFMLTFSEAPSTDVLDLFAEAVMPAFVVVPSPEHGQA